MEENTHDVSVGPERPTTHDDDKSYSGTGNTSTYDDTYENASSHSDTDLNDTNTHGNIRIYYNGTSYSGTLQASTYSHDNGTSRSYTGHNNTYLYGSTHAYHNGTPYGGSGHATTYTYDIHVNTNGTVYTDTGESDTYGNYGIPFPFPEDYNHDGHLNGPPSNDYDDQSLHYSSYFFEKIIYLYIWEILVIITCLFNIIVISVLLRKKMRSPTYMILMAVSISDSLTGLVTLPTYIPVFQDAEEIPPSDNNNVDMNEVANLSQHANLSQEFLDYLNSFNEHSIDHAQMPTHSSSLSTELCTGFMVSKFFLSKSFHTVSVWLTVFLATHRVISVLSPFKSISCSLNIQRTSIICTVLFILAPLLHVYHLLDDKSSPGHCEWSMGEGEDCDSGCAYLWVVLMLGHFLPCTFLLIFTVMFAYNLGKNTSSLQRALSRSVSTSSNQTTSTASISKSMSNIWRRVSTIGSGSDRRKSSTVSTSVFSNRQRENRRASVVVIAIVVMFLIPEVPYSVYLVYNAVSAHTYHQVGLKTNRSLMAAYDILMVFSFNANFYIYTFFNRRFRQVLWRTIIAPLCRACSALGVRSNTLFQGTFWRRSSYSINAATGPTTRTQTDRDLASNKSAIELVGLKSKKKQNVQDSSVEDDSLGRNVKGEERETSMKYTIEKSKNNESLGRKADGGEKETSLGNTLEKSQKNESLGRNAEGGEKETSLGNTIEKSQKNESLGRNAEGGEKETSLGNTIEKNKKNESSGRNAEKEKKGTLLKPTIEECQKNESFGRNAIGEEKEITLENTKEGSKKDESLGRNAEGEEKEIKLENTKEGSKKDESLGRNAEEEEKEPLLEQTIEGSQKDGSLGMNAEGEEKKTILEIR